MHSDSHELVQVLTHADTCHYMSLIDQHEKMHAMELQLQVAAMISQGAACSDVMLPPDQPMPMVPSVPVLAGAWATQPPQALCPMQASLACSKQTPCSQQVLCSSFQVQQ